MDKKDFYHSPEYIRKQSIKKMGKENPNWKGGCYKGEHSYTYSRKAYIPLTEILKQQYCLCGATKKLITHHIDGNYEHNELKNITIVCRGCHNKIHKTKKNKGFLKDE